MEKKEQVYQHIRTDTITKLKEEQFESLGLDTLTVSLDLKMNRANISRLLNQLYNEGRLIKTDSRPVFFMDRSALDRYVEHAYIPSIIPKDKTIKDYLATANASHQSSSFKNGRTGAQGKVSNPVSFRTEHTNHRR